MKAVVCYFTGTGDSLRAADLCRKGLAGAGYGATLWEMRRDGVPPDDGADAYGFCFPVYSLGAPRIVRGYLRRLASLGAAQKTFVLATAGDESDVGWSLEEAGTALAAKGFDVAMADAVEMPANWLPFMYVPSEAEAAEILARAEDRIGPFLAEFLDGRRYRRPLNLEK